MRATDIQTLGQTWLSITILSCWGFQRSLGNLFNCFRLTNLKRMNGNHFARHSQLALLLKLFFSSHFHYCFTTTSTVTISLIKYVCNSGHVHFNGLSTVQKPLRLLEQVTDTEWTKFLHSWPRCLSGVFKLNESYFWLQTLSGSRKWKGKQN